MGAPAERRPNGWGGGSLERGIGLVDGDAGAELTLYVVAGPGRGLVHPPG